MPNRKISKKPNTKRSSSKSMANKQMILRITNKINKNLNRQLTRTCCSHWMKELILSMSSRSIKIDFVNKFYLSKLVGKDDCCSLNKFLM